MNDDLNDIEAMLTRYRPADPDESLRQRVITARPKSPGLFWEALAASVVVVFSLLQVIGSAMATRPTLRVESPQIREEWLEGLTEDEQRMARIALAGSAGIRALPQPRGDYRGAMLWETH